VALIQVAMEIHSHIFFRANLIPGQTLVVLGAGNHWSGFTIWFEANG